MLQKIMALSLLTTFNLAMAADYDVLIRNGMVYDGTGAPPYVGDVAISGDRVNAIGSFPKHSADIEIDASGLAVAPGFFNMLSHAHLSLTSDGRAMSDVMQGVTFEVLSEISLSPLTDLTADFWSRFSKYKVEITWRTLGEYLQTVENKGDSVNFATFVSAATVRMNVIGLGDVDPTPEQLDMMKTQVAQAMEDRKVKSP